MLPGDFAGPFRPYETNGTVNFSCLTGSPTEILYDAATIGPPQLGRKVLYTPCTGPAAPPSRLSGLLAYRISRGAKIARGLERRMGCKLLSYLGGKYFGDL